MTAIRRDVASLLSPGTGRDIIAEAPAWLDDALCAQVDPGIFYPHKGASTAEAKRICGLCEVREECLAYAIETGERHGVWGGMTERHRAKLAREPGRAS